MSRIGRQGFSAARLRYWRYMMINAPILPIVAASLIDSGGFVLVQKRAATGSMAGLWEFPGGKIDEGETPEAALKRELHEELGVEVEEADLAPLTFSTAPLDGRHLVLLLYAVRRWSGVPKPIYAQEIEWVAPEQLRALHMPPADAPFIPVLEQYCRGVLQDGSRQPLAPSRSVK